MRSIKQYIFILCICLVSGKAFAQLVINGTISDRQTGEPLVGAEVVVSNTTIGTITNSLGEFVLEVPNTIETLEIRFVGYETVNVENLQSPLQISMEESVNALNQVVVSANREKELRSEVPAAISTLSPRVIEETAPNTLDQVLNKIPGVFVADLANEQHMTSIRQPISTKGLFLFLEDGLPTRPTGVFNHNAMNELNQGAIRSIEVIRGPASSTYGAEAIGGVINVITQTPSLQPSGRLALRSNSNGLQRSDFRASNTFGKTGVFLGGYYSRRRDGFFEHSDMDKYALSLKVTQAVSAKTDLNFSVTYADLDTDMTGSLDSAAFFGDDPTSPQTFTERTVSALRVQSTLNHDWNAISSTTTRIFFRDNSIGQIPSYRIRTDRTTGIVSGTINERTFKSVGGIIQHSQELPGINAKLIGGLSIDYSPTDFFEDYILVDQNDQGINIGYTDLDSALTKNEIDLTNLGTYATFQISPIDRLKFSASIRYDRFNYEHRNFLTPSSFSGSPDATSTFEAVTPKIGITYDLNRNRGIYANFAQGFVPPQVSELYRGVQVPTLDPSVYNNYELGGWYAFQIGPKFQAYANLALYHVNATNQIISVQLDDGTRENQNAGETQSQGVEYMLSINYTKQWQFRWSGSFARHEFVEFIENGNEYNGNEMAQGANVQYNWEITYRPQFVKGLRLTLENQYLGPYWMNNDNTKEYEGFSLFHVRTGYRFKGFDLSASILNISDKLWSPRANASRFGTTYTPGIPRTYQLGLAYHFGSK
ncbi:MAG: TonB-dependent receptor [Cyclobacteriaceae bacterium]|nr:TonB-dependent receptor [Cyclobacteriaceae bacterium HetDA_MAG_MS6]